MTALRPKPGATIPEAAIEWRFTTSGGPGGQHANRTETRVEASLDLRTAPGLSATDRQRAIDAIGPVLVVRSDDTRSQSRNRAIAFDRLEARLVEALRPKRTRRKTKPSRAAKARRRAEKRRRSATKALRQRPRPDD